MPNYRGHFSSSVLLFFQPTWRFFKSSQMCRLPAPLRHPGKQWDSDVCSLGISFRAGSLPMGIRQISAFISSLGSSPKNSTNIIIEGVGEPQENCYCKSVLSRSAKSTQIKRALVLKFPLIMFIWEQAASCLHGVTEKRFENTATRLQLLLFQVVISVRTLNQPVLLWMLQTTNQITLELHCVYDQIWLFCLSPKGKAA